MTEAGDSRNPRDYYIIDTRTPDTVGYVGEPKNPGRNWAEWDLTANPEYKAMVGMRGEKLKKAMAETGVELAQRGRPENFHGLEHLTPEVARYYSENGFIWIHKDNIDDAKRIMLSLRKLDKGVEWHTMGIVMSEEELKTAVVQAPGSHTAGQVRPMIPGAPVSRDIFSAPPSKIMGGK